MGGSMTKQSSYNVSPSSPEGTSSKTVGGKGNKSSGKSGANTPKKQGSTSGSTSSPKLHQKLKGENQNAIAEEDPEDVELDQVPNKETTFAKIQTPPQKPVIDDVKDAPIGDNQFIIATVTTAQSATGIKKTTDEDDDSVNEADSTPSISNLSSETPSHHATGEKPDAAAPTPKTTPLYTTPLMSATKVDLELDPEISSPNTNDVNLSVEHTNSDIPAEDSASGNIEAKLVEERTEEHEESKDSESVSKDNLNENKAEEVRAENETAEGPVVHEPENLPVEENKKDEAETEEPPVENNTEAATVDRTEEEIKVLGPIITNEPSEEEPATIEENAQADISKVDITSEENEKAENPDLLVEKRKLSPSQISNTAEGDRKVESSSAVVEQSSAEQLHVTNCLEEIKVVKGEAETLKIEVDKFNGTKEDRDYLHLSEMLMRKLYKLDSIESKKDEEIRKWKKDAVLFVKDVTQLLEDKVVTNSIK